MRSKLTMIVTAVLFSAGARLCTADDGAALYKTKCAGCHGPSGEGKSAIKAPAIKDTKMSLDQLTTHLTKGESSSRAPHNKAFPGMKEGQAKAIAEYVKTLK